MEDSLQQKHQQLKEILQQFGSVAVAFSGGVDSALLLQVAAEVLPDKVIAVTAKSASFPEREGKEAKSFCLERGIPQFTIWVDEMAVEGFRENTKDRCYFCKREIFSKLLQKAKEEGMEHVVEGSNVDDLSDYRPGLRAIRELGVSSPLQMAHLTKKEIRQLSRLYSLPTWKKPSLACLASRFPYGDEITREKLLMVDQAEQLLWEQGFSQARVRIHGTLARIEVPACEFKLLWEDAVRERLCDEMKKIGFSYVTLDLQGYRTGSMNEVLKQK